MALKKCRECGNEVSTSAKVCPSCGKKHPVKRSGILTKLFLTLAALFIIAVFWGSPDQNTQNAKKHIGNISTTTTKQTKPKPEVPAMAQQHPEMDVLRSAAKSLGNGSEAFRGPNGIFLSINIANNESTDHFVKRIKAIAKSICKDSPTSDFSVIGRDDVMQEVGACDCSASNKTVECGYVAGGYSPF
jgi:hypothetical protein